MNFTRQKSDAEKKKKFDVEGASSPLTLAFLSKKVDQVWGISIAFSFTTEFFFLLSERKNESLEHAGKKVR